MTDISIVDQEKYKKTLITSNPLVVFFLDYETNDDNDTHYLKKLRLRSQSKNDGRKCFDTVFIYRPFITF